MWKTHPLFTDYQANELGEIRCLNYGKQPGNIQTIKQTKKKDGYLNINLREQHYFAHRFVWECFYGIIDKKCALTILAPIELIIDSKI